MENLDTARRFFDKATIRDNVATWDSNGQHPFDDMLDAWVALGLVAPVVREATAVARMHETARFMDAYRAAQPATPSAEELIEMRAAFGPGTAVVDVITGRTVTT